MRVLLLLDGPVDRRVEDELTVRGHAVVRAPIEEAERDPVGPPVTEADLVVLDAQRVDVVTRLATSCPGIEVVLVGPDTGRPHPDVIERLDHPLDPARLLDVVDDLADVLDGELLREPVDLVAYETLFAGESPQIRDLLRRVRLVARSSAPVWIFGDDGSGRAIIARAVHDRGFGRAAPFIAINTTAHDDAALASLLFEGDGAAIARARGGTLFLEGIAATGPITQRELVRYLETREAQPAQPRLIVGIHRDHAQHAAQSIVSDLYYRLKVLEIEIPALRERARDLEHIAGRMLERLAPDGKRPVMTTHAMRLLERYTFPGNLLELAHALTHAYVLARGGAIEPQHLPISIRKAAEDMPAPDELEELDVVAKRFERDYLLRVLRSVAGNRGRAAEILGLSRKGLWGKLKAHGISDDDIDEDAVD